MNSLIIKLHEILNLLKGFEAMYSTKRSDRMIVKHNDTIYLIEIKKISDDPKDVVVNHTKYLE